MLMAQSMYLFDDKLIEETRKRAVIYNPINKSNRYVQLKEQAWAQISEELGVPVKKCKARWASLRDRYRRITKAQQLSLENGRKVYSKWRYYEALNFLSEIPVTNLDYEAFSVVPEFEVESMFSIERFQKVDCTSIPEKVKELDEPDPMKEFLIPKRVHEEPTKNLYPPNDATDMFFMSLARRIKTAQLPQLAQMKLESDILNFTINQLELIVHSK